MTIRTVEIERLCVTSAKPFEVVVAALKAAVGHPENDVSHEMRDAVSASRGSPDARKAFAGAERAAQDALKRVTVKELLGV